MYTYLGLQKCEDKALLESGARDVCASSCHCRRVCLLFLRLDENLRCSFP